MVGLILGAVLHYVGIEKIENTNGKCEQFYYILLFYVGGGSGGGKGL